jgi:hypothetical protein
MSKQVSRYVCDECGREWETEALANECATTNRESVITDWFTKEIDDLDWWKVAADRERMTELITKVRALIDEYSVK